MISECDSPLSSASILKEKELIRILIIACRSPMAPLWKRDRMPIASNGFFPSLGNSGATSKPQSGLALYDQGCEYQAQASFSRDAQVIISSAPLFLRTS